MGDALTPGRPIRRGWSRYLPVPVAVAALATAGGVIAYAFFTASASGSGLATAATVGAGLQPSVTASGTSVTVSWPQVTLSNGAAVAGYIVRRYGQDGVAQPVSAGCAGTVTALSCTDVAPSGTVTYTDTPVQYSWQGAESPKSAPIAVATQVTTLTTVTSSANPSLFGDMVTFTATVSPAPPSGETVTFADGTTTLGTAPLSSGIGSFTTTTALSLGSHSIQATYPGDAGLTASSGGLTQVVTRILVTPATAPAGSSLTVRGAGWPANLASIQVSLGTTVVCVVNAGPTGGFTSTCSTPTTLPAGTYTVSASAGTIASTGNQVKVAPAITGNFPTYANPTNTVFVNGAGYAANSALTVTVGTTTVVASIAATDATGQFTALSFNVPAGAPAGATTITVTDAAGDTAGVPFTVYHATIAMSPTSQAAAAPVTVSGSGWPAGASSVQVWLGPIGGNGLTCFVGANASGVISQTCPMPTRLPQGTYTVMATDNSITTAGNQETVRAAITDHFPNYANPTNTVTLSGGGFAANSPLTVTLGTTAVAPSITSTGSLGQFNGLTFPIPAGFAAGATTITVADGATPVNSVSIPFTVTHATVTVVSSAGTHVAASGSTVTVSGTGWPVLTPADSVTIGLLFVVQSGPVTICTVTVDNTGSFNAPCALPDTIPAGTYPAQATDGSITTTDPTQLTITPSIALSPTTVAHGGTVTINGSGFLANSAIHVTLNGVAVAITSGPTSTNVFGRVVNTVITIPATTSPGSYTVTVSDSAGPTPNSASAALTVT